MKTIFISYSWGSDQHQAWVKKFSDDLQARLGEGFKVLLDQNQRKGTSLSRFMKKGLKEADKVLIIGTPKYKEKSEASGGVAYETMVITNEMMSDMDTTKFYPILRSGTFETSFPTDIKDRIGDDFSDDNKYKENLQVVVDALIEELSPQGTTKCDYKDQAMTKRGFHEKLVSPDVKKEQLEDSLIFSVGNVSFKMIRVEGGSFMMGANEKDREAKPDEKPNHQVTLSSYFIGETVVTQELWRTVMDKNPSRFEGDNRPVEFVSYSDCESFIKQLSKMIGKSFRLPTEAEWEYAARGGKYSMGYKFSGSNTLEDVAWYAGNSGNKTHDVAMKKANELGIFDMCGNVDEWCSDRYGAYMPFLSSQLNPKGISKGTFRICRGGNWSRHPSQCRLTYREMNRPETANEQLGFRLAFSE